MSAPFVPVTAQRWATAGVASGLVPRAVVPPAGFQPLARSTPAEGSPPAHVHTSPQVVYEREGDQVTRIRIQCGCGEVIVLECLYD